MLAEFHRIPCQRNVKHCSTGQKLWVLKLLTGFRWNMWFSPIQMAHALSVTVFLSSRSIQASFLASPENPRPVNEVLCTGVQRTLELVSQLTKPPALRQPSKPLWVWVFIWKLLTLQLVELSSKKRDWHLEPQTVTDLLFYCCVEVLWPRQLIEETVYGGLSFRMSQQSSWMRAWSQEGRNDTEAVGESLYLYLQAWDRELTLNDALPPTKPYLQIPPN